MKVGGGAWGGGGTAGTEPQSVWIISHTSFRPITALTGNKRGGGGGIGN